jgi:hypothetical protein
MPTSDEIVEVTIPDEIVRSVKCGKCILFLGAMASAPSPEGSRFSYVKAPPSGAELSRRLAALPPPYLDMDKDSTNLPRVSLYRQLRKGGSRKLMIKEVKDIITKDKDTDEPFVPSDALHMLAALPFPFVITTNYDRLFDMALSRANTKDEKPKPKQPITNIYKCDLKSKPEDVPMDPEEDQPVLLKLHGDIAKPKSIVITEEDYIRFIQKMGDRNHHPLHGRLRARLTTWPLLFIGYSLKDYNLRLLFKTLMRSVDDPLPLSYSVDPKPDNLIVSIMGQGNEKTVDFIEYDLWTFVPELYRRVIGKEYKP